MPEVNIGVDLQDGKLGLCCWRIQPLKDPYIVAKR